MLTSWLMVNAYGDNATLQDFLVSDDLGGDPTNFLFAMSSSYLGDFLTNYVMLFLFATSLVLRLCKSLQCVLMLCKSLQFGTCLPGLSALAPRSPPLARSGRISAYSLALRCAGDCGRVRSAGDDGRAPALCRREAAWRRTRLQAAVRWPVRGDALWGGGGRVIGGNIVLRNKRRRHRCCRRRRHRCHQG